MTDQPLEVSSVTIGAPDVPALAMFYHRLLGWTVAHLDGPRPGEPDGAGWAQLRAPDSASGLRTLNIEWERAYVRPVWPSEPGSQNVTAHLDLPVGDVPSATAHAIQAGAVLAEAQPQPEVRVLLDPAGHPFCLFPAD